MIDATSGNVGTWCQVAPFTIDDQRPTADRSQARGRLSMAVSLAGTPTPHRRAEQCEPTTSPHRTTASPGCFAREHLAETQPGGFLGSTELPSATGADDGPKLVAAQVTSTGRQLSPDPGFQACCLECWRTPS